MFVQRPDWPLADATNSVWLLPDSEVQLLLDTVTVYFWDVEQYDDEDLVLFDDLRTCAASNLDGTTEAGT